MDGTPVGDKHPPYVVSDVGSNHMGSLDEAKSLIIMAAAAGTDACKFQKRDSAALYTKSFFDGPYNSEGAYGLTYFDGEH